jgi:hypothetical protein
VPRFPRCSGSTGATVPPRFWVEMLRVPTVTMASNFR